MRTSSKSFIGLVVAIALVASLFALTAPAVAKVNIVCSLPTLGNIAAHVGGDRVSIICLAKGSQDPHFVDPKPSFMVKIRNCNLFCEQGLELEIGWVPPLLVGSGNPDVQRGAKDWVDCSEGIPVLTRPTREVTRAQGDVHPYGNPHYDIDPLNAIIIGSSIMEHLKAKDPAGASAYETSFATFSRQIWERLFGKELVDAAGGAELDRMSRSKMLDSFLTSHARARLGGWMAQVRPIRAHPIIAYHKNLEYFADRFGIDIAGYIEPKPGVPPSPGHLVDVVALMRSRGIKLVVTQPFFNPGAPNLVASKTGGRVAILPTSVDQVAGVDDYFQLIDCMCKTLTEDLK